ncbi:MAG: MBL fold metallo-hydrolase [Dehalococcoidia bacterium]|nr:MBL fold metallo-hydrolase [Dehalococcoidia bacterium]
MPPAPPAAPHAIALAGNVVYALPLAGGGALLVDAGPDCEGSWEAAVAQLAAAGFAPPDVRVVLVTHAHLDHAGLAGRWAAAGARIRCGAADRAAIVAGARHGEAARAARLEALRRHGYRDAPDGTTLSSTLPSRLSSRSWAAGPRPRLRWEGAPAQAVEAVADGERFALADGDTLRVVAAPGHTPGNLVAITERTRDLYSGDTLLPGTIPTPGLHFPRTMDAGPGDEGARWPSLPPFLASAQRLRALAPRRVLPGHGAVVADPPALLDRFEAHYERRLRRVRALLAGGPASAYALVARLFPRLPRARVAQAMTEAIGLLDVLAALGEGAWVEGEGGTLAFRLGGGGGTLAFRLGGAGGER